MHNIRSSLDLPDNNRAQVTFPICDLEKFVFWFSNRLSKLLFFKG